MVVLAASIINKSGKPLASRQFVDMSRVRIEGYLAAFPKLIGTGKQHTYVETEHVRYVYQPMESLYLLLITNKQSNILQDLETLSLLAKLVATYTFSLSLDEEGIAIAAFNILFVFDEIIALGHKEGVTLTQVMQYIEMESIEERVHNMARQSKITETKAVMNRKANEIAKSKTEKSRGEKGGSILSVGGGRTDTGFGSDTMSINGGIGGASGFGLSIEVESFTSKTKDHQPSSATAPAKGFGMQLGKTQKSGLLESLKAEGEVIIEDLRPTQSKVAAQPLSDPVTLTIEEKLNVTLKHDGGIGNIDLQGSLSLQILNQEDGLIQVQIETGGNPGILFKTHPNINKEQFSGEKILALKDPNRPFPTGQTSGEGVSLLRWRMQSADESLVPLSINCWPSPGNKETYVNLEYVASQMFELHNVLISVPLPTLQDAPRVTEIDGEWRYDSRKSILEWSIILIDNNNRSGTMEFVVPAIDKLELFPISVRFTSTSTFSDLKVVNVLPLRGGNPPKFSQTTFLSSENYQVVCSSASGLA